MKSNFNDSELLSLFKTFGHKLNVRINKAGNIDVVNPKSKNKNEHFVLYLTPNNRYLWRRWFSPYYCYPLNMVKRKKEFKIENCEFNTVNEAIDYFKYYLKKYHKIEV